MIVVAAARPDVFVAAGLSAGVYGLREGELHAG